MEETGFASLLVQTIASLALVLAIFAGLVWGLRRVQQRIVPKKDGQMQVVQRLYLDSKNSVVEIKYGHQHFLLGVGQGGVQKIGDISPQTDVLNQDDNTDIQEES